MFIIYHLLLIYMSGNEGHNKNRSASRRRILQLTGSSIAIGALPTAGATETGETEKIVTVRGKNGTPRKVKEVPGEYWEHVEKVHRLQEQLRTRYSTPNPETGIDGIGIGSQEDTIQGRLKSKLLVYVKQGNEVTVDVPETIEGIPVEMKEWESVEPDSCEDVCNKSTFDPLPGGVPVDEDDNSGPGTTTCMVERSGTYYMMTARHIFGCEPNNVKAYNYKPSQNYIGEIADYSTPDDWAIVPLASDSDISEFENEIVSQPGVLAGHVTKSGLQDLKDNKTTVYHQGWRTCETSGVVEAIDQPDDPCGLTHEVFVKLSTCTMSGDSGGPHFHQYESGGCYYNAIIAPHRGGDSIGCAAYHIHDAHEINFDPLISESDCII